jgi:hypothetical protein
MKKNIGHSTLEALLLGTLWIIIVLLGAVGAITILVWASNIAVSRGEKAECIQWQHEAKQYPNYYLAQWQKDECDRYQIIIEAPVK